MWIITHLDSTNEELLLDTNRICYAITDYLGADKLTKIVLDIANTEKTRIFYVKESIKEIQSLINKVYAWTPLPETSTYFESV